MSRLTILHVIRFFFASVGWAAEVDAQLTGLDVTDNHGRRWRVTCTPVDQ